MAELVDRAMLEAAFPPGTLVTLPEAALGAVTHAPSRAFLRDVGLPDHVWLNVSEELRAGELGFDGDELAEEHPEFDFDYAHWACLGSIAGAPVHLDVATGTVYSIPDGGIPARLNSGLDALAYFLCLLERERPNYDFEALAPTGDYRPGAEDRLRELMTAADPVAFEPPDEDSEFEPGEPTWELALRFVAEKLQ
ncbi:SUKH-4 family immunity protein [Kitasatospora sp. NPDC002227]|uniref:SUKH-4 family immunity protein n=1 Tax=Kitasatospora sp. NPDC002227 TaxID=3154773 RepID=UPI003324240C